MAWDGKFVIKPERTYTVSGRAMSRRPVVSIAFVTHQPKASGDTKLTLPDEPAECAAAVASPCANEEVEKQTSEDLSSWALGSLHVDQVPLANWHLFDDALRTWGRSATA